MLINIATQTGFARDEGWRVKKDGSIFWASIAITAIHDDEDNVIGFTKVTKDLTQQKACRRSPTKNICNNWSCAVKKWKSLLT